MSPDAHQPNAEEFWQRYEKFAARVSAFVATRLPKGLRAATDDICQEVWIRVWTKCPPEVTQEKFPAWLFTVARHAVLDHCKKKRASSIGEMDGALPDDVGDSLQQLIASEESAARAAALRDCVQRLDDRRRQILLGWLRGLPMEHICTPLGINAQRGYKLNHEAKQQLKDCVQAKIVKVVL